MQTLEKIPLLLVGILALLLAACGGSSGSSTPKPEAVITLSQPDSTTFSLRDGPVAVALSGQDSNSAQDVNLTYQWQLVSKPTNSNATLNAANTALTGLTADLPGDYVVSLTVNDGKANSAPVRVTLTATSPVPVASTPSHHSVRLGTETLGLNGTASTPPTGETGPLQYLWTLISSPANSAASVSDYTSGNATLHLDLEGEYVLQLVVSYDGVDSAPARVEVIVSSGNAQPVAEANDITIKLGESAVLDGSASHDPEGEPLQYRWQFKQGGTPSYGVVPQPQLSGAKTSSPSFLPSAVGEYQLDFFVYDGTWKSAVKTVKVTVEKPDSFPEQNLSPIGQLVATGYYPSSSVGEQEVGLRANFDFQGYDPEGETLQLISSELLSKPAGSNAVLEDIGSWQPLGKKIAALDVAGDYVVRHVISDGVNEITSTATMTARIGQINNRPLAGGIEPVSASTLAGNPIIFQTRPNSVSDPDGDPLTFHWTLFDKPDGSNATLVREIEPESGEYRRARVVTDVPGVYVARLEVEDDRGLRSSSYAQTEAIAKLVNNPPELRRILWRNSHTEEAPYQILPCMFISFIPVIVDPDGDKIYTHRELISTPEGGNYGNNRSNGCATTSNSTFNKPGTYVFRYLISDGIADLPEYDFTVVVDPIEQARGVTMQEITGSTSNPTITGKSFPHHVQPNVNSGGASSTPGTAPFADGKFSLTAVDGDYTLVDLEVRHLNGNTITPYFDGIEEGQVIAQGDTIEFALMRPTFNCLRNEEILYEGLEWSFRIQEIPEATFFHQSWRGAILNNGQTPWPICDTQD